MILAINIENTNTIIGCMEESKFIFVESISTNAARTALEYAICMKNIFDLHGLNMSEVNGSIISSVVPPVTNVVKEAVERICKKEPIVIGPGVKTGLNIMTDNPAQVGSDLVANAVAGIAKYEAPMLIVNMGTASTITVINEKKQYVGGMIMPGLKLSSESLSNETAQLPKVGLDKPKKVVGKNTVDCMKSGLIYGTVAMIEGSIARIENEIGTKVEMIIATGENMKYILPCCDRKMTLDETLLLEGLGLIYERNCK